MSLEYGSSLVGFPLANSPRDALDTESLGLLYCTASTLLIYDFFITFSREVQHLWGKKFTGATILYYVIRYVPLVSRIPTILSLLANRNDERCLLLSWMYEVLIFFTLAAIALISALRVYAVWSLDFRLFLLVFLSGMILPCIHLYIRARTSASLVKLAMYPSNTCQLFLSDPLNIESAESGRTMQILLLASRVSSLISDALVVLLIWSKTFTIYRGVSKLIARDSIATLLVRDGALYFLIIVVINVSFMFASKESITARDYNSSFDFVFALSSVLMCHFILHLRENATPEPWNDDVGSPASFTQSAHIRHVLGPLGMPIQPPHFSDDV